MTAPSGNLIAAWTYLADNYPEEAFAYHFPALHAAADWRQPLQRLDTELDNLELDPGDRALIARLYQLPMRHGPPQMVIIHVAERDYDRRDFERRMNRAAGRMFQRWQAPFQVLTVDLSPPPNLRRKRRKH